MATAILEPISDSSVPNTWGESPTGSAWSTVDEGCTTPNDSDFVQHGDIGSPDGPLALVLQNTPSDFGNITACTIQIRGDIGSSKTTGSTFQLQIFQSDGTTALTTLSTAQALTTTTTTYSIGMTLTGNTDKAHWDGAILKITDNLGTGGSPNLDDFTALEVDITYNQSVAFIYPGSPLMFWSDDAY